MNVLRINDDDDARTEHGFQGRRLHTAARSFLWGYLKNYVFYMETHSLSHMKERIKKAIENVSTETLEKV